MAGLISRVVLITGASSGIGAETAVQFARVGANVVLMARTEDKLEETAQKCRQEGLEGSQVQTVVGDIMKDADLHRYVDTTIDKFGRLDVLVNNAGECVPQTFSQSTVDDVDLMYRMHARSPYLLTKLAMPHLLKQKGNVVNVSSIVSHRPIMELFAYGMAKGAQDQFMKAAAIELGKDGIRLNSVCPATIKTDLFQKCGMTTEAKLDKFYESIGQTYPLKRVATPDEVAKVIVFLASDDASFISGQNLPIDAGRMNTMWNDTRKRK